MGFLHQLKLLLWKNYTLKKRSPFMVAFEILIPLVLFLILMGIRQHRRPYKSSETFFPAKAMPSAGIVPLLQSFCPNAGDHVNEHGFPEFPNASIGKILNNIADIYHSPGIQGIEEIRNLGKDLNNFVSDPKMLPESERLIKNFALRDVVKDPDELNRFLVKNLSIPQNLADALMHSTINGSEASKILLEKRKDIFRDYFLQDNPERRKKDFRSLQKSILMQALFDPLSLQNGPTWMRLLRKSSTLQGLQNSTILEKIFKKQILGKKEIKSISCDRKEFSRLFVIHRLTQSEMEQLEEHLCNISDAQLTQFSKEMQGNLNWTAITEKMRFAQGSLNSYKERILKIQKHLETLANVEDLIKRYSVLSEYLKFNMSRVERSQNSSHARKYTQHVSEMWRVISPILCGPSHKDESKDNSERAGLNFISDNRQSSVRALRFMLYMLTHDPKILYSPNGTDADKVINKASHLLMTIKRSKTFARQWLNASATVEAEIKSNETQKYLKELLKASVNYPDLMKDWTTNISRYISNFTDISKEWGIFNSTVLRHLNTSRERLHSAVRLLLLDSSGSNRVLRELAVIDNAARAWLRILKPIKLDIFYGFPNETALNRYVWNATKYLDPKRHVLSAVLFDNIGKNGSLPRHVQYRIRMDGRLFPSTKKIRSRYWFPGYSSTSAYHLYGFIWLQDQIERALIEVLTGKNVTNPGVYMQEMPYPCYLKDRFLFVIQYIMPLCITVSFIYSVAILVQSIVYEKEQRLKEVMKMMGLNNAVHWTAWFIMSMCTMSVIVLLLTVILKYGGILQYSNVTIIWLFLTLVAITTTAFCFLLSVFFSKAKLAAACGGIVYFLTYMPYVFISIREGGAHINISAAWKMFASLLSTTAFGLGARYFALFEQNGSGVQWSNVASSPGSRWSREALKEFTLDVQTVCQSNALYTLLGFSGMLLTLCRGFTRYGETVQLLEDEFNLGQVFAMLIFDTFLYSILTWYIEAIYPGAYGLPRPWYFPFQLSYWCGHTVKSCKSPKACGGTYSRMNSVDGELELTTPGLLAMEAEPIHLTLGVAIDNLVKVYKSPKKVAVDSLTLNLYEGQITSFLGHNGAGKTTTMSMLTGLFPSTSGTAVIYGNDIHTDMDKIRTSLGMCPQHNVLFDRMTVEEHLWFYSQLKGMDTKQVLQEMDGILEDIGLPEKRNSAVESLSGGMKRKLSVAMAFVGGSRTVILDEPTAGVDPYARRAIWDLLVKYKQGRTILLSTHFMDEADILGDRIAIISHGKLRCCGSSLFLKTHFGDGYHLTMVKDRRSGSASGGASAVSSPSGSSLTKSPEEILKYIQNFVPTAQLICETQHELSFILPDKGLKKGMLRKLFENLEKDKVSLGSKSFGLNDTTLEEVFLKVTETSQGDESGENDLLCEVETSLPTTGVTSEQAQGRADSGIELDDFPSPSLTSASKRRETEDSEEDESASNTKTAEKIPLTREHSLPLSNKNTAVKGHRRSHSHDFFRESPAKSAVCAHRRTSSGHYLGHRRALSSDYQVDQSVDTKELTHKSASKLALFGHRRTGSGASRTSQDSTIWEFECDGAGRSKATRATLRFQQFYGLLLKRFHHSRRNFKGLISQIFLPAIFICIAMTVALSRPGHGSQPRLILSPTMFRPPPNYIPYNNEKRYSLANKMEETLSFPSGVGADCVLKVPNSTLRHRFNFKTSKRTLRTLFDPLCAKQVSRTYSVNFDIEKTVYEGYTNYSGSTVSRDLGGPKCRCSRDMVHYLCDPGVEGNPEAFTTVTRDTVLNVTGRNISEYLMFTTNRFKRHRYGGLTFGEVRDVVPDKLTKVPYDDIRRLFVKEAAKGWYNNKGYHALPTYLNVLNNAILRATLPENKGNPAAYGITAVTHPFNLSSNALDRDYLRQGTDVVIAIFVIIAMSFVPASFVVFLVTEKTTKAKHLQFVSGVDPILYWLSNFLWDMLNYMIPALACMVILKGFGVPAYASSTNFPAVCCLFLLYGYQEVTAWTGMRGLATDLYRWSITPLMYPAAFIFKEASTAYVVLIVLNLFVGITFTVTVFILQLFPNDAQLTLAYNILRVIALAFPNYCLGRGLMDLAYNEVRNEYYKLIGEYGKITSPFEWELVTRSIVAMAIEGLGFFIITLLIEYGSSFRRRRIAVADADVHTEDEDVAFERQRVLSGGAEDDLLKMENLTKTYRSKKTGKHLAVNKLCLGVSRGECFGLLGVNGAGKTSTFKMLTGDTSVTAGDAFIKNHSIILDPLKVNKSFGYCPQFDALIDELTAEEHLALYARLRGVPEKEIHEVVNWAVKKLALTRYANKPSKTYSGGNKRKLSAAIALLGNPPLIFMDEPTTGMDPGARRFLWNLVISIIQKGTRSVILTSHSMEECEALCTRLAIMVNGQFKCLGSAQHLKNKFGEGYILTIRIKGDLPDLNPMKAFIQERFPEAMLKETHHNLLQYQIPSVEGISLSVLFTAMDEAQDCLDIEDFSVSQTTLDNVFINFAKNQMDSSVVEDNTSLVSSELSPLHRIKSKWRTWRRRVTFNKEMQFSRLMVMDREELCDSDGDEEEDESIDINFHEQRARLAFHDPDAL